jgi:hypothetical protein
VWRLERSYRGQKTDSREVRDRAGDPRRVEELSKTVNGAGVVTSRLEDVVEPLREEERIYCDDVMGERRTNVVERRYHHCARQATSAVSTEGMLLRISGHRFLNVSGGGFSHFGIARRHQARPDR